MFRNYLRVAFRSLLRNRFSAFINLGGLAIGISVALLIGLWIQDELSFDKYHENYGHIVQVLQKEKFLGETKVWEHQPFLLLNALRTSYGNAFEHIVASVPAEGFLLSTTGTTASTAAGAENQHIPSKGFYMDADGPDMLTLKMIKGSRSGLGADPHSILLAASVAKALFGDEDPIGKRVNLNNLWDPGTQTPVVVRGVYEDLPHNTTFNEAYFFLPWSLYTSGNTYLMQQGWDRPSH